MGRLSNLGWVGLTALLLFVGRDAFGADPKLKYWTIETEHFHVHYHQGLEDLARRGATIFEEVHRDLSIIFEWEEPGPIHIVITDTTDRANGSASSTRYPRIRLYATTPSNHSTLQYHDHWMRTLFIHEYTHIVTLRIHSGFARILNTIFGTVYLPNAFSPRWYHEGVCVLLETYETTAGRIRSPNFPMTLRAAVLDNAFPTLSEVSNASRNYPRGAGHYIYGAMFMDYLAKRFGMEKIKALYHEYGSKALPYGMNRAFKNTFGTDLVTLYYQWTLLVTEETLAFREELENHGTTRSTRITFDGETKGRPVFAADDRSVLLPVANGKADPTVYRIPLDGGPTEGLVLASAHSRLSTDRAGRLFYTRDAPVDTYYRLTDLFVLESPTAEPRRVTHGARTLDAAISPRGDRVAVATTQNGTSALLLADERGNPIRTLIPHRPETQVLSVAWSTESDRIAAVVRRGPKVDLVLVDVQSGTETFLTDDWFVEDTPVFHPNGTHLLYKSNRTGVDNIFARDLQSGVVTQVTRVLTGATRPAVSNDGKTLAFIHYSSIGYDLHTMPLDLDTARSPLPNPEETRAMRPIPPPATAPSSPYNPLISMAPSYWKLNMATNTVLDWQAQALASLDDATGRHHLAGQLDYDIAQTLFSGRIAYSYSGLGPGLHLGFSRVNQPRTAGYSVDDEDLEWVQKVTRFSSQLSFPIFGLDRNHNLSAGYFVVHGEPLEGVRSAADPTASTPHIPAQGFRAGLEFQWRLDDSVTSPLGISPHKGRNLSLRVNLSHPYLGGDQTLASVRYAWTEYMKVPGTQFHVLALRLSGGVHISDPPRLARFRVGGYAEQNVVDVIWNNSPAGLPFLRGYARDAFEGDRYHSLRFEYRFPIWFAEATSGTFPIFLKRVHAGLFTDNMFISFEKFHREDWRSALGAELVWVTTFSYFRELEIRSGYARGVMAGGTHEFILTIGNSF